MCLSVSALLVSVVFDSERNDGKVNGFTFGAKSMLITVILIPPSCPDQYFSCFLNISLTSASLSCGKTMVIYSVVTFFIFNLRLLATIREVLVYCFDFMVTRVSLSKFYLCLQLLNRTLLPVIRSTLQASLRVQMPFILPDVELSRPFYLLNWQPGLEMVDRFESLPCNRRICTLCFCITFGKYARGPFLPFGGDFIPSLNFLIKPKHFLSFFLGEERFSPTKIVVLLESVCSCSSSRVV